MSDRDIRDIAAYYGAPVQVTTPGEGVSDERCKVDWSLLHMIERMEAMGIRHQLCLRPIASLTDEELLAIIDLSGYKADGFDAKSAPIRRFRDCIEVGRVEDLTLVFKDMALYQNWMAMAYRIVVAPGAVTAYLQSIHIYVPGTIDEKYVDLIQP